MFTNFFKTKPHPYIGRRVRCILMDDIDPVPPMTEGTIYNVGLDVMNVKWDNGRNIGLVMDSNDKYELIDNLNETTND